MKQEDLFKKLGLILNELNDQYSFLAQNPQQLNELELELFQANAKFLTDHIQIIKKINLQSPQLSLAAVDDQPTTFSTPQFLEEIPQSNSEEQPLPERLPVSVPDESEYIEVDPQPVTESRVEPTVPVAEQELFKLDRSPSTFEFILNDHSDNGKFEFEEEKNVEQLFNRPLSAEEEQILAHKMKLRAQASAEQKDIEEDEIGPEPFLVTKEPDFAIRESDLELSVAPPSTIEVNTADPVEDPSYKPTLNDLLAKSNKANFNTTATGEVKDLKQAISLNEKLLYIKDLFNGYNLAYAEAIDLANKLPNFEAADSFFQKNYAVKNNWAAKQSTVDQFYTLLSKRFS